MLVRCKVCNKELRSTSKVQCCGCPNMMKVVDEAKLGTYHNGATGLSMPVLPIDQIQMPFVVCVSMRNPELVAYVQAAADRLGAIEGTDFFHFN